MANLTVHQQKTSTIISLRKRPHGFLLIPKALPPVNKWQYIRKLIRKKQLSQIAQLRLEWIIFYHTVGKKNACATTNHFGISRSVFYKWLKRFDENRLETLEEHSKASKQKRIWTVTTEEEQAIKHLREQHIQLGREKLQVLYEQKYGHTISQWKITRVIRKHKLYPHPLEHKRYVARRRGGIAKARIHQMKEQIVNMKRFGYLWHVDTVIIWWYGKKRYIFTAIEEYTRLGFARVYSSNISGNAEDFLKRLLYLAEGKVELIHTDNGAEFQGAFEKACKKLGITQIYSRPHTPKDNAKLERFNRTLQKEWLDFSFVGLDTIEDANRDLTEWLVMYNSIRPHAALGHKTPLQYMEKLNHL